MTTSICGEYLGHCRCRYTQTDQPRSAAEIKARHREFVKRAQRSDKGEAPPIPAGNMRGRQRTAQARLDAAVSRALDRRKRRAAA